jgi:hypothetical protein
MLRVPRPIVHTLGPLNVVAVAVVFLLLLLLLYDCCSVLVVVVVVVVVKLAKDTQTPTNSM